MMPTVRPQVETFLAMAPLPASAGADEHQLQRLTDALMGIPSPVSRDEAIELSKAFGPDECFGLAWTLVHLIESAPGGAPIDAMGGDDNEWVSLLKKRRDRSQGT